MHTLIRAIDLLKWEFNDMGNLRQIFE